MKKSVALVVIKSFTESILLLHPGHACSLLLDLATPELIYAQAKTKWTATRSDAIFDELKCTNGAIGPN